MTWSALGTTTCFALEVFFVSSEGDFCRELRVSIGRLVRFRGRPNVYGVCFRGGFPLALATALNKAPLGYQGAHVRLLVFFPFDTVSGKTGDCDDAVVFGVRLAMFSFKSIGTF